MMGYITRICNVCTTYNIHALTSIYHVRPSHLHITDSFLLYVQAQAHTSMQCTRQIKTLIMFVRLFHFISFNRWVETLDAMDFKFIAMAESNFLLLDKTKLTIHKYIKEISPARWLAFAQLSRIVALAHSLSVDFCALFMIHITITDQFLLLYALHMYTSVVYTQYNAIQYNK